MRFRALAATAYLTCAVAAGSAHAQAWVPEPGTGTVSLEYQLTKVRNHLFSVDMTAYRAPFSGSGNAVDLGHIDGQTADLAFDYGLAHNLAFSAGVAYVAAIYRGPDPESSLDNGKYHATFQDVSLRMRYMLPWHGFAITPNVGYTIPTHDYATDGHTAVGRGNASFNTGVALGRTLAPWAPSVWLQGGYTHEFVRNVMQFGLDENVWSTAVGWFPVPKLSASGYFSYLDTQDGIDWFSSNFTDPNVEMNHDRAAKALVRRAGGNLSFEFNASRGVYLDIGKILSGANTHDGVSYTLGTNWTFAGIPAIH